MAVVPHRLAQEQNGCLNRCELLQGSPGKWSATIRYFKLSAINHETYWTSLVLDVLRLLR